jgi:hypothetical protein
MTVRKISLAVFSNWSSGTNPQGLVIMTIPNHKKTVSENPVTTKYGPVSHNYRQNIKAETNKIKYFNYA